MIVAEPKTQPNDASVEAFLQNVANEVRRRDSLVVLQMMQRITGHEPRMWGASIVGFGRYQYRYESGREGDSFLTGFSPRKQALTLYIMPGFREYDALMRRLGKYRTGKSCLYINRLEDVDLAVLEELVRLAFEFMDRKYPTQD
jgi:hypothetical protein